MPAIATTHTPVLPARFPVAGVLVSQVDYAHATAAVVEAAINRRSLVAAATSVHGLAVAARNAAFKKALNTCEIVTPDGQPVRWALNALHGADLSDRVYGPTLMLELCRQAAAANLRVFLYGSTPEILRRLELRLREREPMLQLAGSYSPPFRPLSASEDERITARIRESGANIIFVGLGCPRQEFWAVEHRGAFQAPLVCVGAAFDFHAGALRQAPPWMQARGLEWLFRLLMEPRRLWRRYLYAIPLFTVLVAQQVLVTRVLRRATYVNQEAL
jgi:N-acetylglucosaminyldiphosphoundecaprenol N-acetyl-beta-D-mannosaminyltransferase